MDGRKQSNMIHIHKFVTEDDINHYKSMSNAEIKELLDTNKFMQNEFGETDFSDKIRQIDLRKLYGLPEGDIDVLLQEFRKKGFTGYYRKNPWRHTYANVLNSTGEIVEMHTWSASFRYVNKWNQESDCLDYKMIVDENKKILWLGFVHDDCFFLSDDKTICGLKYEHKTLVFFPNICSSDDFFNENDLEQNDQLIKKYKNNIGVYRSGTFKNVRKLFSQKKCNVMITIDDLLPKGFFYKGPKWNRIYDFMSPNDKTILVSIQVKEGFFYIEIENITYPHYGYILLGLKNFSVIEAKMIEN